MAYARYGAKSPEWWKHLREFKRSFWKKVRRAGGTEIQQQMTGDKRYEVKRPERLAEALREEISEVVGFELEDPRVEAVTVTDVTVSDDLRDAKVFVVIEGGGDEEARKALTALQHASTYVRQQVAMNLSLRHAPHLHFVRDTAEENAARVGQILNEMAGTGELEEKTE